MAILNDDGKQMPRIAASAVGTDAQTKCVATRCCVLFRCFADRPLPWSQFSVLICSFTSVSSLNCSLLISLLLTCRGEGEVCVRGKNVTPGYLNNEEANKACFTRDGWFRTGDQGVMDEQGETSSLFLIA